MAPENKAQPRAFYDHESDGPVRRRRPAADWGVGEDIFDRMPSPRFSRTAEGEWTDSRRTRGESMTIVIGRDESTPDGHRIVVETDDFTAIKPQPKRGDTDEFVGVEPGGWSERAAGEVARRSETGEWIAVGGERRDAGEAFTVGGDGRPVEAPELGRVEGRGFEDPLGRDFADAGPNARRTVKISGHPDRLPVPRTQRPPRTVVDRLGTSPDRIAAYAVALGFLLVLIAVLTTGQ
jgi:hypothetical protein